MKYKIAEIKGWIKCFKNARTWKNRVWHIQQILKVVFR